MAKAKLGLRNLGPNEVVAVANTIITSMTGNANFATPNPPLPVLTGLKTAAASRIAAYNTALAAAEVALAARDGALKELCGALTLEASYVDNASGGSAAKIESAGMGVRTAGGPLAITQVLKLVLSAGDYEETLAARWKIVKGANSYEVQVSADPLSATSWTFKMSASKSKAILAGLSSGARLWVRVRAIGADNKPGPWSDPALKTVP